MILPIEVKGYGQCDYVSVKKRDGASGTTLSLSNLNGVAVTVEIQNDMGKNPVEGLWKPYPNDDRTAFIITDDTMPYGLRPTNNFIRLSVPDGTDISNIIAMLS